MLMLRSLFLKLVSILDFPLMRIGQCELASGDLVSVSEFYSQLLVRLFILFLFIYCFLFNCFFFF